MLSFITNLWGSTPQDMNSALPEGAILKANPTQTDFDCIHEPFKWKVTVLNHTKDFIKTDPKKFHTMLTLNSLEIGSGGSYAAEKAYRLCLGIDFQITAYCMEDHENLFFFEIMYKQKVSLLSNIKTHYKYCINTDYKRCPSPFDTSIFIAEPSDEKISEITKYITEKRKFNQVLNSFRDEKSFFYKVNIPQDIIGIIAILYFQTLKSIA